MKRFTARAAWLSCWVLPLFAAGLGCASDQKHAPTAEEVRDGEALPPAPPVPARPMPTDSPAAEAAPGSTTTPPPEPPPAYERLSEAQLAKVTELVSRAELDQSRLALRAAQAAETKRFAAKMIEQHSAALREQARLVKKLGLTPADSTTAAKVKTEADAALRKLESADKTGFDAAYVNSQIEGHRKVLELLDAQLVPAASTPEVSEALRRARSALEQHLSEARALKVD